MEFIFQDYFDKNPVEKAAGNVEKGIEMSENLKNWLLKINQDFKSTNENPESSVCSIC